MTLIQFIFVSSVLMPKFLRFRDPETGAFRIHIKKKAPFKDYVVMVLIYFVSSVSSNKAFELGINQPFNVIFRSLSLLVSYIIACQQYKDAAKATLVSGYVQYIASDAAQQAAAKQAGSAPLSSDLAQKVIAAAKTIK